MVEHLAEKKGQTEFFSIVKQKKKLSEWSNIRRKKGQIEIFSNVK